MQRIESLLQKLQDIAHRKTELSLIEVDLMMDYTRIIYADLAEMHSRLIFTGPVVEQAPAIIEEKPEHTTITLPPVPVTQQSVTIAPEAPAVNNGSMQQLIGINDTYMFINELFDGDRETYEHALSRVESMPDYDKARDWLFDNYTISADSEAVQAFLAVIERYFVR